MYRNLLFRRFPLAAMLLLLLGTPTSAEPQRPAHRVTSFIELVANPEQFSGETIQIFGWLRFQALLTLYLTEDHAKATDHASSIAFLVDKSRPLEPLVTCSNGYVFVSGRVEIRPNGRIGLTDIASIRHSTGETCYEYGK